MSDTVIVFLALLAIACQAGLLIFATLWLVSRRGSFVTARATLAPYAAPLAFAVALVTMLGSLYLSEVKHYVPCNLCWIQRGLLYPQVLFTALLWWNPGLVWIRRIATVLLVACVPVSIYHYLLEWYPNLETSVCTTATPCTLVYVREFGYVSTPLMALTAALTILGLLYIARPATTQES